MINDIREPITSIATF